MCIRRLFRQNHGLTFCNIFSLDVVGTTSTKFSNGTKYSDERLKCVIHDSESLSLSNKYILSCHIYPKADHNFTLHLVPKSGILFYIRDL
jgi:hypothetical protein